MSDIDKVMISLTKFDEMREQIDNFDKFKKKAATAVRNVTGMSLDEVFERDEKIETAERMKDIREGMRRGNI